MQTNTSLEAKEGDYTSPTHALDFLDLKLLNRILITIPCTLLTLLDLVSTLFNIRVFVDRGLGFLKDKTEPLRINYVVHIVLTVLPLGLLIILTSLLVSHLYANRTWRLQNSATTQARKASLSSRDIKSIRLVTVVAALIVSCYLPVVTIVLVCFFRLYLNFNGKNDTVIPYLFNLAIVSLSMS
ncbi:FMRFamide receptor [Biomphalaria glabrata]|nr:FMRFamide receptor-like [Biomphalaria glabrata]